MNKTYICPVCGVENEDNWPLELPDGSVQWGGCQEDWEAECAAAWWKEMAQMAEVSDAD